MIETITPAVCGSRRRHRLALAGFALGAIAAAAAVGALLGLAGSLLGPGRALVLAAVLALAAAAREAGLVRFPLPQARRQVPERWAHELPLPAWSLGYGAGLGAGFLTYQPVATFWVACAAAVALGRPVATALCFTLYGAGRAALVVWPRRGQGDATAAVEDIVSKRGLLGRANVAALAACAALLVAAPLAEAAPASLGPGLDPSISRTTLARGQLTGGVGSVLIEPQGESALVIDGAAAPSLDGDLVAYVDSEGIRVANWRSGEELAQVPGPVSKPSLRWPLLAYHHQGSRYESLRLADLDAGTARRIARVKTGSDLGRPSLRGGRLAWHKVTARGSQIVVEVLATGRRTSVAKSKIWLHGNPSVTLRRVVWVEQRSGKTFLRWRRHRAGKTRTAWKTTGRSRSFWTTSLQGRIAYVTRWSLATRESTLYRVQL